MGKLFLAQATSMLHFLFSVLNENDLRLHNCFIFVLEIIAIHTIQKPVHSVAYSWTVTNHVLFHVGYT